MGRKQNPAEKKEEPPKEEEPKEEEAPEEPALVKALKEVDDKYLAVEKEFDKEVDKLRKEFEAKQKPFLEERKKLLLDNKEGNGVGTPACPNFWLTAMQNHPMFEDVIHKWDEPVLEYLVDITNTYLDPEDTQKGFTITFSFAENDYFTNTELCLECQTERQYFTNESTCKATKASVIEWKPGKDVTVEKTQKKVKGGGAKKAKQKGKETIEPRESFFRVVFRTLKEGDAKPEDFMLGMPDMDDEDDEDGDDDQIVKIVLENILQTGSVFQESIIPFAVRWYTGEADPDYDSDDEDEDDESEDEDLDDDDDDSEDDDPAPKKGAAKKGAAKKSPKSSPSSKPAQDPKAEECKQQ